MFQPFKAPSGVEPLMTALGAGKRKHSATGWVYVAEAAGDRVKIGWTRDPDDRMRRLESSTDSAVYVWALIPGSRADERRAHQRWAHLHIEGEWFRAETELLEAAEEGALL